MREAIPRQHPAVVLRSHYELVRALLALATVAAVCLAVAVAVVVAEDDGVPATSAAGRAQPAGRQASHVPAASTLRTGAALQGREGALLQKLHGPSPTTRFDGGPEEGTRGAVHVTPPTTRFDGGPEEGTRGAVHVTPPTTRFDGGPEEGTRGAGS